MKIVRKAEPGSNVYSYSMKKPILLALTLSCISPLQAQEAKPNAELVQTRFNEATAATAQFPEILWNPDSGHKDFLLDFGQKN
jgi:hypothetical protein